MEKYTIKNIKNKIWSGYSMEDAIEIMKVSVYLKNNAQHAIPNSLLYAYSNIKGIDNYDLILLKGKKILYTTQSVEKDPFLSKHINTNSLELSFLSGEEGDTELDDIIDVYLILLRKIEEDKLPPEILKIKEILKNDSKITNNIAKKKIKEILNKLGLKIFAIYILLLLNSPS